MLINELLFLQPLILWRLVRVVEGARLESVYTSKGYRGFESLSLRFIAKKLSLKSRAFFMRLVLKDCCHRQCCTSCATQRPML